MTAATVLEPNGPMSAGERVTISRAVEWRDTDAAGRWHYATAFRLFEAAEVELLRQLGCSVHDFASLPRVHVEVDLRDTLVFDDVAECAVEVIRVGRTSITYRMVISAGSRHVAEGSVTAVLLNDDGVPTPLPNEIAERLQRYRDVCSQDVGDD